MGAAGIGGDVAAHGAGDLARRVGRIEEAVGRRRLGDADIGDAGLDAGDAVGGVDLEHLGHAREAEHERVLERERAAAQRGAGSARHDLDVIVVAEAQDLAHLFGGGRQHDGERQAAVGGERVGFEGSASLLVGNQARLGHELAQLLDDVVPEREHRGVRGRKADLRHRPTPGQSRRQGSAIVFRMGGVGGQYAARQVLGPVSLRSATAWIILELPCRSGRFCPQIGLLLGCAGRWATEFP